MTLADARVGDTGVSGRVREGVYIYIYIYIYIYSVMQLHLDINLVEIS